MSSVDPKPTYTLQVETHLLSLALSMRKRALREYLMGLTGLKMSTLERLDVVDMINTNKLADMVDDENMYGEGAPTTLDLIASREDIIKAGPDNDGVQCVGEAFHEWSKECTEVHLGCRAVFALSDDVVIKEVPSVIVMKSEWAKNAKLAAALGTAGCMPLKMHPSAVGACHQNMLRNVVSNCSREWHEREVAEDISYHTVSRRVRAAYTFALTTRQSRGKTRTYETGVTPSTVLNRLSGQIRRDEECAVGIDYFYMGQLRAIKRNKVLYIMNQDNIRKVYHLFHRRCMAITSSTALEVMVPGAYSPRAVRSLTSSLITASAAAARGGGPVSNVPRAMHQLWCAEFAASYDEPGRDYWSSHYVEIKDKALGLCESVPSWLRVLEPLSHELRLELLRLHHILPAADTPADLVKSLTFAIPGEARRPDSDFFDSWMKFVKTYELCMYLYRKKEWPNTSGDAAAKSDQAYSRCLKGRFQMPAEVDFGKLQISNHFEYILHADQLPLKAKDATRVPYDHVAAQSVSRMYPRFEHNELLHALKRGANLGSPGMYSIQEARRLFWDPNVSMHVLADTAAKAEVSKADIKPRCTFSANGEFRHIQAEFDRNVQSINDIIGCGSLRADPSSHAKGLAHVALGTRLGRMTSSHDITGWSTSQDRDFYIRFGMYRASIFKGLDPKGWASKWRCFDVVVNKPGCHAMMHQTNGGYQGYPPTMDTSLHVLILTYFLWRMREKKLIPSGSVTLAKATIDDCLAQIGEWLGSELDLERELYDHYIRLGYEVDSVKSVISKTKSIYLNQAFIRGGIVNQGLKVILKLDRPLESIMGTPFEDFMSCTSGAKAAIAAGHEALSAYFLAAMVGIGYLYKGAKDLHLMSEDMFTAAAILPRSDGGLSLPLLPDLVCKEHPDSLAHSNHVLFIWCRGRRMVGNPIDPKALKMVGALKTEPWRVVGKTSIFFNPRQVSRISSVSLENVRRSIILSNAREWCEAEPYKSVLRESRSEALAGLYSRFLSSDVAGIDAAFLEAFSSHLPESILDALVGKVTSYAVAAEICGSKEIILGQTKMGAAYRRMVNNLLTASENCPVSPEEVFMDLCETPGYVRAKREREEFYAVNMVHITSHTVPSPFEVVSIVHAEADIESMAHIASDYQSLIPWTDDVRLTSRNSVSKQGIAWPFKAKGWVADSSDEFKTMDSVTHKFVEGCAILCWAREAGLKVKAWEHLFLLRWAGDMSLDVSEYVTKSLQGSIKRSSSVFGDKYHPVFCYPNLQRSTMVNAEPLLTLLSNGSYDIDPMSIIATCYAIGAVNSAFILDQMALAGSEPATWAWQIGIHPSLYEEQRHLEVEVTVPLSHLLSMQELELEGTEYIAHDEGTAAQLKAVLGPLGLRALTTASSADYEGEVIPRSDQLAPMVSMPAQAPLGAAFLLAGGPRRIAGTIAVDRLEGGVAKRLLEVSPSSSKLCVISALAECNTSLSRINSRLLGDPEAISDDEVADVLSDTAVRAVALVRQNIPTSYPLFQVSKAMRACGLTSFRWDDVGNSNLSQFRAEVHRASMNDIVNSLAFIHSNLDNLLLSAGRSYHEPPKHLRTSRDPDKSNESARVVEIKKKFKMRSKEYELRIKALKAGHTTIQRDSSHPSPERKIVYLVAARSVMECVEFADGPSVNWTVTATRLLGRINSKLDKLGHSPTITDPISLLEPKGEGFSRSAIVLANSGPTHNHWHPDQYARGCTAAASWLLEDCEHEKTVVYYAPRAVEVRLKVRQFTVTAPMVNSDWGIYPPKKPIADPLAGPVPVAEQVIETAQAQSGELAPSLTSLTSIIKSAKKDKVKKSVFAEFCSRMEAWQLVIIHQNNGEDPDIEGSMSDKLRVSMQGHTVVRSDLSAEAVSSLEKSAVKTMYRNQSRLVAPTKEDVGLSEDLVV
jgi:hypothetical protein